MSAMKLSYWNMPHRWYRLFRMCASSASSRSASIPRAGWSPPSPSAPCDAAAWTGVRDPLQPNLSAVPLFAQVHQRLAVGKDLKNRKVRQLGELVIATGADNLSADELKRRRAEFDRVKAEARRMRDAAGITRAAPADEIA